MFIQMTVMHRRGRMRRNFESEYAIFFSYFNASYVILVWLGDINVIRWQLIAQNGKL